MTVKVTKCPAGFAHGYTPMNGSTQFEELRHDTLDVCNAIRMHSLMSTRFHGAAMPNHILKKLENRLSWQHFCKALYDSASN